MIRYLFFVGLIFFASISSAQDTSKPWFPDDDDGFFDYLAVRFAALGHDKPSVPRNGEPVIFTFIVTDSGEVDSVRMLQCFQSNLCLQLRLILYSMPRVNAAVVNGKTVPERRTYSVLIKPALGFGYVVENNPNTSTGYYSKPPNKGLTLIVVVLAVVALLVVVVK